MSLVERRYAEALTDLPLESDELDMLRGELGQIVHIYETDTSLKRILLNAAMDAHAKKAILKEAFGGRINRLLLNFLLLLVDKGRISNISGIFGEFDRMVDQRLGILKVVLYSNMPLEERQEHDIAEKYRRIYNAASVKTEVRIDPALLGGVVAVINGTVIDASVKSRLEGLKKSIVES